MTPATLRRVSGQLSTAASRLEQRSTTFGGARDDAQLAVDGISDVWTSPLADVVHGRTSGVTTALRTVTDPLDQAVEELRGLADSADRWADDLASHQSAADAADEAVASAGQQMDTAGDPDRIRQLARQADAHSVRAQQERERAEGVILEWEQAVQRVATTIGGCADTVHGHLVEAASFDPTAAHRVAASGHDGLTGAVIGALTFGDDLFCEAPSSLSLFIDELGPGPLTPEQYQEAAREYVRSLLPEGSEDDPYAQNAAVTRAYAEMYFLDPDIFKWAGMAAFASDVVGDGMRQAEGARQYVWAVPPNVSFTKLAQALYLGNALVYDDIYWQHIAYEHGGLEAIEQAWDEGAISREVYDGWHRIDEGRRTGDEDLIWEGNRDLLFYEQRYVLQEGVYDHARSEFTWLSSQLVGIIAPLESPIPGDDSTFQDIGGDLGVFDDRWTWIDGWILPAWREHEGDIQDQLREFTG